VGDRNSDVGIVERALAILEEETRAWVTRPLNPEPVAPATSAPDEHDRGDE
jgi:hypothetical protein